MLGVYRGVWSRNRKLRIAIIIAALMLVVSIALFVKLTQETTAQVTKDISQQFAREINSHMIANIDSTIDNINKECSIIENSLSFNDELNEENISSFVEHMTKGRDVYIGLFDSEGYLYDYNGKVLGTTVISAMGDLLNGKEDIIASNVTIDGVSYILYGKSFSSGIRFEDKNLLGVFLGMTSNELSRRTVLTSNYSKSFASIIEKSGYYVIKNKNETTNGKNEFLSMIAHSDFSQADREKVLENSEKGENTLCEIKTDEEKMYYVLFSTVPNTDWLIVNHIPEEVIKNSISILNLTTTKLFILTISIILVTTFTIAIILMINIKELNQTSKKLDEALTEANEANKAKSVFISNMSHDIRTPINAIIGMTNIAKKFNKDARVENSLEKIETSSSYLLSLINDVLDISRIESGKTDLDLKPTTVKRISDSAISIIQDSLADRKINFETETNSNEDKYVLADALRIREVLINILGNSVKFTDDGGTIRFETEILPGDDEKHITARFIMSDTGIGMSKDFLDKIYREFVQETNDARTQYKGTGLGMAITKKLVDLMNGTISIESEKGVGSKFTVELPLELTEEIPEYISRTKNTEMPLEGLNVLLAEDNDLNAEIAVFVLSDMEMNVTRVHDGKTAVETFRANPPGTFDVILMDVMMPKMNGYEATSAIRAMTDREDSSSIPIIAMTANAFAEDIQAALKSGMNDHVAKPIDVGILSDTIQRNIVKK